MEQSLRAAAQIIADYERSIIPDDPFIFSACYQLAAAIRPYLPSPDRVPDLEQNATIIADTLAEMSAHDLKIEALIHILNGTAPTAAPHVNHTPAAFVISPTHIHGNQYNLSGDFRGAIVNVASALEGVVQHVQAATLELAIQAELIQLLRMLRRALEDAPATHTHAAEAIAATVAAVIGTALSTEPNALSTVATDCALAATQLDSVLPEVSKLAAAIVTQAKLIRQ